MKNNITLRLNSVLRKKLCSNFKPSAENLNRKLFIAMALAIFLCSFNRANAQTPTFNYFISNDHLVSPTVFEFDVSIQNTSANGTAADSLKFRTAQQCFTFNPAFINGAIITATYVAGSTQIGNYGPGTITYQAAANGFQVAANTGVACSNGTFIPAPPNNTPKRVATFRMTATPGAFGCAPPNPNMVMTGDPAPGTLSLRMAITEWNDNDGTCNIGTNVTVTGPATQYTQFATQTQYGQVNNNPNNTSVVTNSNDAGPGSLRQAIIDACPGNIITFNMNAGFVTSPISLSNGQITIDRNLTIQGPGANLLTVQNAQAASSTSRVFLVNAGVTATISGLTISGGNTNRNGGGICNYGTTLNVNNSTISNNSSSDSSGGGIYNSFFGVLNITNSTISNNSVISTSGFINGGGIRSDGVLNLTNSTISNNQAGYWGGGISAYGTLLNVTNSTISNNVAGSGGGGIYNFQTVNLTNSTISNNVTGADGGGGILSDVGELNVINSTIANNTSTGGSGGGIYNWGNQGDGIVNLTNSTVSNNSASYGGGINSFSGRLNSKNSIIAGNTAPTGPDNYGNVISQGFNLVGKTNGTTLAGFTQPSDLTGTIALPLIPLLGPLANNGGPTFTMALLPGSPAIDKGSAVTSMTTDQRGFTRPSDNPSIANASGGNGSDIGAYEVQCIVDPVVTNNANSGAGSLRQAVIDACPGSTITFDMNTVTSPITLLNDGQITIDKDLTIQGPGANLLTVKGTGGGSFESRVFEVNSGVTATISGLTVSGGYTFCPVNCSPGSGISNSGTLSINNSTISNNTAEENFGSIYNSLTGNLTVNNCTISNNQADEGGGIYNKGIVTVNNCTISNNSADEGGGIYILSGTVNVTNSTLSNNSAGDGGGIFNLGIVNVTNSTISNNKGAIGGGICILQGTVNVTNSTISNNSVTGTTGTNRAGGGIYNGGGIISSTGTVNSKNSIIAGNTGPSPDFSGTLTSLGYNLIGSTTNSTITGTTTGNILNPAGGALLGPLANNGGPTQTLALLPGSPAIDNGTFASGVMADQRGNIRPFDMPGIVNAPSGDGSDIGAFELQCVTPNAVATPAAQTKCSGAAIETIVLTGNVSGTVYNWTRDNDATVTGISASDAGDISGSLTNTTNAPITVVFTITPTADNCPGSPITATVLVNPNPTPTISGSTSFCDGSSTTLDAGTWVGYNWSTGETTQTISVNSAETFTVTVTDVNGCTGSTAVTTTVNPNPNPTISGSTSFCDGSSTTLDAGSYESYEWSTGETTQTISVNTAGTFTVTVTDANGCTGSTSVTTTVNPNPTPTISGSTSFCDGSSTTLDAGSYESYEWSTGETTQTISVNSAETFTVTVADANGCTGSTSVTTSVNANPTPTISGSTSFCDGSSTTLDAGSYESYEWSTGETTQTISVNTAGTFTVTVTDANGCTGSTSVTTTVNPNPTPTISGSTLFCAGSSTTLDAGTWAGYNWSTGATTQTISVNTAGTFTVTVTDANGCTGTTSIAVSQSTLAANCSGTNPTCGNADGTSAVSVIGGVPPYIYLWSNNATDSTITGLSAGTYTVTVTDAFGCTDTCAVTLINGGSGITPTISCNAAFCAGKSTLLDAGAGYIKYKWSTGATTRQIIVNTANTFTVTVTDANGCTGSASVTTTVYPLPSVSFSGLASSYNVNAGYATLTGSPSGGVFSGPGISGNKFYPNVAGVGGPYTITYSYTNSNGCSKSVTHQTSVTGNCIIPAKPGTIAGSIKVCPGESKTYSISPVANATSYLWTPPTGCTVSLGQGGTTVTVNYGNGFTTSGSLTVKAVCACGSSPVNTLLITKNTAPALPSVISGASTGVCNGNAISYSITNVAGNAYTWGFSTTTASITLGQGTNSVKAKFNANFTSGNITVKATNGCGTSATRSLAIKAAPAKPGTITGNAHACANQSNVPYSISPVSNTTNYTWAGPIGSHIKAGSTTSSSNSLTTTYTSVNVNFGATVGAVKVRANNACGSSDYVSKTVTVNCREVGASLSNDFDVVCYPVPAKAELNVEFNAEEEVANTIIIRDVLGKTLLQQAEHSSIGENKYLLDVSILSSGIYMIEVINGEHKSIQKIMIE